MPNHLRIFLDLEFARRALPSRARDLALAFDAVYKGGDPKVVESQLVDFSLPRPLRPIDYDLCLHQLFIAEQEISYPKESNFDPRYLFLQGWIRTVLSGTWEIDRLLKVAQRFPPGGEFTRLDNRKHPDFQEGAPDLWYLAGGNPEGPGSATKGG
jgi:hypothetical protein